MLFTSYESNKPIDSKLFSHEKYKTTISDEEVNKAFARHSKKDLLKIK
jgi:hypothetical protein